MMKIYLSYIVFNCGILDFRCMIPSQRTLVEAHIEQQTPEEVKNEQTSLGEAKVSENFEMSINYVHNREKWDQNQVIINNIFSFQMVLDIIRNDENPKPQNGEKCRNRNDWQK